MSVARSTASFLWKLWYPVLTRFTQNAGLDFLNYGYADSTRPLALTPADAPNRACIGLYHHVGGMADLAGKSVLEVSCGHGGGAAYVARTFAPARMTGLDRNGQAIAFCRRKHTLPNLTFTRGNALALPFDDATLDAVLNVEASHCYPDVAQFFAEVRRVLTPGGHFLYADFRDTGPALDLLKAQIAGCSMQICRYENISHRVVEGMDLNHDKYTALIQQHAPRFARRAARRFAGVQGSQIYTALLSGETEYFAYHLQKPEAAHAP